MKIKFVYGILPALIIETNHINKKFMGYANGPFVRIRPHCIGDPGLLAHELTHVKQFYRTFGLHGFIMLFSKSYKLASEVEAYREQLKYYPTVKSYFAFDLAALYGFDITQAEAARLLS